MSITSGMIADAQNKLKDGIMLKLSVILEDDKTDGEKLDMVRELVEKIRLCKYYE